MLAQLERRAELVRAGVITDAESQAADHAHVPIQKHFDSYVKHLQAKGCATRRVRMIRRRLEWLTTECGFGRLGEMSAGPMEQWLVQQKDAGLSVATRNGYREAAVVFGNWCRRTHRLTQNPFADVPRADARTDRRHQRRALAEAELLRLLKVAPLRPLGEYGREVFTGCPRGGETPAAAPPGTGRR